MGPAIIIPIVVAIAALLLGAAIGYYVRNQTATAAARDYEGERQKLENEYKSLRQTLEQEAKERRKELEDEARTTLRERRKEIDAEATKQNNMLEREEKRLERRIDEVERRSEKINKLEQKINARQSNMDKRDNALKKLEEQKEIELQNIAKLTEDEAKEQVLAIAEKSSRDDMARIVRQIESEAKEEGERRARKIVITSMQRVASIAVSEHAVTIVPIPSDEMKGRIIGRAGRNIRAFEQAAGVNVIVDDTPEAITVSSFDPVRREVAKRALMKLVQDGRIHPAQIEKLISDAKREVEVIIKEEGERAAYEAGVVGLHPEILRLVGTLKFRTSYGQDQNAHAIEAALLAGAIASEIGANVDIAKRGALLHDLGKAIDHEVEGTHAAIGAEIARRYGEKPIICNAIAAHHHEVEQESIEAVIVEIADAISGARPGARRESLDHYIKRIKTLEEIGQSFDGVEETYALQAGREIRLIVRPDTVDDYKAKVLARDVAKQIEESMQYPGQVKVTVIRETRETAFAK